MQKLLALLKKPIPHTPRASILLVVGILLFLAACWVLSSLAAPSAMPSDDLFANWSFDSGLSGWTVAQGSPQVTSDGAMPCDAGAQLLRCPIGTLRCQITQDVTFPSSAIYYFSLWTDSDAVAYFDLDSEGNTIVYGWPGPTWGMVSGTYFVTAGVHSVRIEWRNYWEHPDDNHGLDRVYVGLSDPTEAQCPSEPATSTPTPTSTPTATSTPFPPVVGCLAPPDGGFDAVPITSTWFCVTELGQTEHTLFVEPNGITGNTLYWLQDMRFNYPVGEGCYKVGTQNTFQITQTGLYTFTLDYSPVPGIDGIHALWTTAGLIANFPGGPNGPDSQFWTGRLVALDGVTTTITGSQYFSQTGPYHLFFQFIPRRDPFLDGPGTDVIYVDNACIKNQPDATPTPTITPSPTNTSTATPTGTISPTETSTVTPTPTAWSGPPPTATPTVPGGTPGPTPTPQPPQEAGFCDSATAPPFPPDDGSCGPDVSFLADPVGWVRQQLCKLVSLFPRSFTWLGWFLQWLFCPILDVIGGLLCALAVVVPMIQNLLNMVTWIWNFIISAFTAFNFEKDKPVTVFTDFMGGWIWIELTDVIAKLKGTTFFGWLFDWFVRALLWWNTFTWFMSIAASGAGESSTEAQDSEGE